LLATAFYQTRPLQIRNCVRDRGPLHAQHFGKQTLADRHYVVVAAVAGSQRASLSLRLCRPLHATEHLLEEGLNVSEHEAAERRHRLHRAIERGARHLRSATRNLNSSLADDALAPKTVCTPVQPSQPIVAISMMLPSA
jgi:hypothetical protein